MRKVCARIVLAALLAGPLGALWGGDLRLAAQTVTGSIAGSVHDPTDQSVLGASVTLTSDATGETRTIVTSEDGAFVFAAVRPGAYTIRVEISGFSPLERRNTVLPAGETLTVGILK